MKKYFWLATLFFLSISGNTYAGSNDTISIEVFNSASQGIGLEEAFDKVKKHRKRNGDNSVFHLQLHGGEYQFDKTIVLEGQWYDHILITPYGNEKVHFSGGVRINPEKIRKETINGRNAYCIDILQTALKELAPIRSFGFVRPYGASWTEIFVNGKPMNLSRWPNESTIRVGEITSKGSLPYKGEKGNQGGIFTYSAKEIDQWKQDKDIWISGYFCHGYADDLLPVKQIDHHKKTIETGMPHYWGFDNGKPWNQYYFLNVLDEMDRDKEYVLDMEHNRLYFLYEKELKEVVLSQLDQPFFDLYQVNHITFKDITFEYSRYLAFSAAESNNITLQNCVFRNLGSAAISFGLGIKPFDSLVHDSIGQLSRGCIGSLQQHIYAQSEVYRKGGKNNLITGCHFYNLGSSAIVLDGGDRKTLTPGNNRIEYCTFRNGNRVEKTYRPAIHLTGVGNRISNCEISNLPSMAILMHGNNHLIENNYIHDVCYEVDDNGAIYYGRNPTECGNVIRGNFFSNIGNDYSCCSVYIDDCTGGMIVEKNTFYKAGRYAILLGGGSDNRILDNLFVDTRVALHIDDRLNNWAGHLLDEGGLFEQRTKAVDGYGPIYSKAYPYILKYKNRTNRLPQRNVFLGNRLMNVPVMCDNPHLVDIIQTK